MGVDVDSVIFVGKHVDDLEAYLIERGILPEEDFEDFNGDWREHNLNTTLEFHEVSGYGDYGWYVGFEIDGTDPLRVAEYISKSQTEFERITKEPAKFHHWAYYW